MFFFNHNTSFFPFTCCFFLIFLIKHTLETLSTSITKSKGDNWVMLMSCNSSEKNCYILDKITEHFSITINTISIMKNLNGKIIFSMYYFFNQLQFIFKSFYSTYIKYVLFYEHHLVKKQSVLHNLSMK